ncbi:MAG: MBOAT family O-acyltransferase [Myxococcota bacterium]
MVFSSQIFLFAFLPAVLLAYLAVRGIGARNAVLLAASLFFYAWGEGAYLGVLLASIAVNHGLGRWIARRPVGQGGVPLVLAVTANLLLLGFFKYAGFLSGGAVPALADVHLPLGISFFTFQAITYVVDVARGHAPAQKSLFRTALYIALFPQLIAGPIVRYQAIAAQLARRVVSREGFAVGIRRFSIGLGKKVLVANGLAVTADAVFAVPSHELTAAVAWLGVVCYALQIYFDFSGYSDMAIGLGRMFGFRLPENFDHPYVSRSIREFWRRWHITLSTWFRDYLYVPLGGSRRGAVRTACNLLLVFALCGLWHGAAWQFLVWGLFHGAFLAVERSGFGDALARAPRPLQHVYVVAVFLVGWVFFRADDLTRAGAFLAAMAGFGAADAGPHALATYWSGEVALWLAVGVVGSTPWWVRLREGAAASPPASRWAETLLCVGVWWACAATLAAGGHDPFIYFRF